MHIRLQRSEIDLSIYKLSFINSKEKIPSCLKLRLVCSFSEVVFKKQDFKAEISTVFKIYHIVIIWYALFCFVCLFVRIFLVAYSDIIFFWNHILNFIRYEKLKFELHVFMKSIYITLRFCVTILIQMYTWKIHRGYLVIGSSVCLHVFVSYLVIGSSKWIVSLLSEFGNFCEGLMVNSIRNDATLPPSKEPHPFIDIEVTPSLWVLDSMSVSVKQSSAKKKLSFDEDVEKSRLSEWRRMGTTCHFYTKQDCSYFLK